MKKAKEKGKRREKREEEEAKKKKGRIKRWMAQVVISFVLVIYVAAILLYLAGYDKNMALLIHRFYNLESSHFCFLKVYSRLLMQCMSEKKFLSEYFVCEVY